MKSILQDRKECYLCRLMMQKQGQEESLPAEGLHSHHIFGGTANRRQSERYGLKVWLCLGHHESGPEAVHQKRTVDLSLKGIGQRKFEETRTRAEFIRIFGKSWLD